MQKNKTSSFAFCMACGKNNYALKMPNTDESTAIIGLAIVNRDLETSILIDCPDSKLDVIDVYQRKENLIDAFDFTLKSKQ